jgi:hypothetical protein
VDVVLIDSFCTCTYVYLSATLTRLVPAPFLRLGERLRYNGGTVESNIDTGGNMNGLSASSHILRFDFVTRA